MPRRSYTPSCFLAPFRESALSEERQRARPAVTGKEGESRLAFLISRSSREARGYNGFIMWRAEPTRTPTACPPLPVCGPCAVHHGDRWPLCVCCGRWRESWGRRAAYKVELLYLSYKAAEGGGGETAIGTQLLDAMVPRLLNCRPPHQIVAKLPAKVPAELLREWAALRFHGMHGSDILQRDYP